MHTSGQLRTKVDELVQNYTAKKPCHTIEQLPNLTCCKPNHIAHDAEWLLDKSGPTQRVLGEALLGGLLRQLENAQIPALYRLAVGDSGSMEG
jgi:hypothetical protein